MRHQEEIHRQANEEIIRLDGANVLQGARVESVLYNRRTNTESFQRAMASELFISQKNIPLAINSNRQAEEL